MSMVGNLRRLGYRFRLLAAERGFGIQQLTRAKL